MILRIYKSVLACYALLVMKRYSPIQRCVSATYMNGGIAVFGGLTQAVSSQGVSDLFE